MAFNINGHGLTPTKQDTTKLNGKGGVSKQAAPDTNIQPSPTPTVKPTLSPPLLTPVLAKTKHPQQHNGLISSAGSAVIGALAGATAERLVQDTPLPAKVKIIAAPVTGFAVGGGLDVWSQWHDKHDINWGEALGAGIGGVVGAKAIPHIKPALESMGKALKPTPESLGESGSIVTELEPKPKPALPELKKPNDPKYLTLEQAAARDAEMDKPSVKELTNLRKEAVESKETYQRIAIEKGGSNPEAYEALSKHNAAVAAEQKAFAEFPVTDAHPEVMARLEKSLEGGLTPTNKKLAGIDYALERIGKTRKSITEAVRTPGGAEALRQELIQANGGSELLAKTVPSDFKQLINFLEKEASR